MCKGPVGIETAYDLEFTPENLDKLYYQHALGVNGNRFLSGGSGNKISTCNLYVKDEVRGTPIIVKWHSEEETYKLFRNKSFAYLYNGDYMPDAYKQNLRVQFFSGGNSTSSTQQQQGQGQGQQGQRIEDITSSSSSSDKYNHIG